MSYSISRQQCSQWLLASTRGVYPPEECLYRCPRLAGVRRESDPFVHWLIISEQSVVGRGDNFVPPCRDGIGGAEARLGSEAFGCFYFCRRKGG